jgi:SAM-dependent methyltransferase
MMRHLLLSERVDRPEILDEGLGSDFEVRRSLEDLRRLNRWLFGARVTLGTLQIWLRETPKPATILELGTGSGQMAQALARWALREHQAVRVLALDFAPRHLEVARRWNEAEGALHLLLLGGNALALPLADHSVDYVNSSLFLHHFDAPALCHLFRECRRVARRGLAMSDLWRHPLPYYLYKAAAEPLFVRSPVTRADSTVSFHRAYRPDEIKRIAREALPDAEVEVRLHFPSFRWVLAARWDTGKE